MPTSIQIGIFLVGLSCVIYEAHAISCYKCVSYSNGDPWCADDFDKTKAPNPIDCDAWAKEQKLEERPDACYKIVQNIHRIVKGKWFKPVIMANLTRRGCGFKSSGSGCSSLLGSQMYGTSCYCESNRCNAAGSVQMTLTFIFAALAASMAIFKYYL